MTCLRRSLILFLVATALMTKAESVPLLSIDSLIRQMTIEEKVGQMTQVDLGVIAKGSICNLDEPRRLDSEKLRKAMEVYKIGSVLNVGCGSGTIPLTDWRLIIGQLQSENRLRSRLEIPILYGVDAIHGVNYTVGGTLFPQPIGQAATWNPTLVEKANEITAYETRASGIPWNFSPVLDIGRQPLWSRFFETYGEDVILSSSMARAAINGLQGSSLNDRYHVSACMKHFLGYSFPLSGHDRTPAWISPRELREYFLPTFKAAIESGARTVMINSGEINGTPVHADRSIVTELLRNELGFKGVAVTDWEDIYKLVDVHHVAANRRAAVKLAIDAGIDMSMTPNDFEFTELLISLVYSGEISEARIDTSVRRILQLKQDLGLFDQTVYPSSDYPEFGGETHSRWSYTVAAESITLLKNDQKVLPLNLTKEKVLVCGPAANSLNLLNGGWTHTWQGVDTRFNTPGKTTIYDALYAAAPKGHVLYAKGSSLDSVENLDECLKLAATVDKVIVCLGEQPCTEIPGNINDLSLPIAQVKLVQALLASGKPVILVCCFNRPRIIHSIAQESAGIVYAYLPGDEGGRAISDCITGKVNPSGRLPFTYPAATNALMHYDHKASEELDIDFSNHAYRPDFDFGSGLSYTTFSYSGATISKKSIAANDSIIIQVTIRNSGDCPGMEVVQVYYRDLVASITPPVKKLLTFQKIYLENGQEKKISFTIHPKDLSFINKELVRVTEPGEFELMIANQKIPFHVE